MKELLLVNIKEVGALNTLNVYFYNNLISCFMKDEDLSKTGLDQEQIDENILLLQEDFEVHFIESEKGVKKQLELA